MSKGNKGCKLFIGGLPRSFPDAQFREIFAAFGPLVDCVVMRDREGTPRGFGYVTFQNSSDADKVMGQKELKIYGKVVDIKYAISKADMARQERGQLTGISPVRTSKVFVGGLAHQTTKETFRAYFSQFGHITDSVVMATKMEGRGRGFGFVTFESPDVAEAVLSRPHIIDGKQVDCQKADGLRPPRSSASPIPLYSSSYGFEIPSRFPPSMMPLSDPRFPAESARGLLLEPNEERSFLPDRAHVSGEDREEYDRNWQRWGWDPYTPLARTWPAGNWQSALDVYPQPHVLASRAVPVPLLPRGLTEPDLDRAILRPAFRSSFMPGAAVNVRPPQSWNPELGGTRSTVTTFTHFDVQLPHTRAAAAVSGLP